MGTSPALQKQQKHFLGSAGGIAATLLAGWGHLQPSDNIIRWCRNPSPCRQRSPPRPRRRWPARSLPRRRCTAPLKAPPGAVASPISTALRPVAPVPHHPGAPVPAPVHSPLPPVAAQPAPAVVHHPALPAAPQTHVTMVQHPPTAAVLPRTTPVHPTAAQQAAAAAAAAAAVAAPPPRPSPRRRSPSPL